MNGDYKLEAYCILKIILKQYVRMLDWTGERFLPWIEDGQIRYEHLHRLEFAKQFVKNKNVLDLACGEGYLSYELSKIAKNVVGIDIDKASIQHALEKYHSANLKFVHGSMLQIPLSKEKFDVIICFEALEHVADHETLLSQIKKFLDPSGILLITTPNKSLYSNPSNESENKFHKKELDFKEFKDLLTSNFKNFEIINQRVLSGSFLWNSNNFSSNYIFLQKDKDEADQILRKLNPEPMYFLGICSNKKLNDSYNLNNLLDMNDTVLNDVYNQVRGPMYTKEIDNLNSAIKQLESLSESRNEMINKKNEIQKKQNQMINKKNEESEKATRLLKERNEMINTKNEYIENRERLLKERNEMINKKNEYIENRERLLKKRTEMIIKKNEIQKKQNQMIIKKNEIQKKQNQMINKKNNHIAKMGHNIDQLNTIIAHLEEILQGKDKTINTKNDELNNIKNSKILRTLRKIDNLAHV